MPDDPEPKQIPYPVVEVEVTTPATPYTPPEGLPPANPPSHDKKAIDLAELITRSLPFRGGDGNGKG
jgi:hypothetical protein